MSVFVCLDGEYEVFEAEGILPDKWNGFVVPAFTMQQAKALWHTFENSVNDYFYGFDGQQFLMWNDYSTDTYVEQALVLSDGQVVDKGYLIGGRQWCWMLCDEKGEHIEG